MSGHRKWATLRVGLRADPTQGVIDGPIRQATADAVRLGQLREARELTQLQVAQILGSSQANISKIERRDDLYLSTLSDYVRALGGHLELRAVFPDQVITIEVADIVEMAAAKQ